MLKPNPSNPISPYAEAFITCKDGKIRKFVAMDSVECLYYEGAKYMYILWEEPECRGFVIMIPTWDEYNKRKYVMAPDNFQPTKIVATTRVCKWEWERKELDDE